MSRVYKYKTLRGLLANHAGQMTVQNLFESRRIYKSGCGWCSFELSEDATKEAADDFLIDCFLDGCKKIDWTVYEKIEKGDEVTAVANNNVYKLKSDKAGKLLFVNINNQGYKKIKVVERSGWFVKIQKTQIVTNDVLYLISGLYKDIKDNFNLGIKIVHNIYDAAKVV